MECCSSTRSAISSERREAREGRINTVSQDRSAVGIRKPIEAGKVGQIKGNNHMRDDTQMQPDSTGGRRVVGITGRGSTR